MVIKVELIFTLYVLTNHFILLELKRWFQTQTSPASIILTCAVIRGGFRVFQWDDACSGLCSFILLEQLFELFWRWRESCDIVVMSLFTTGPVRPSGSRPRWACDTHMSSTVCVCVNNNKITVVKIVQYVKGNHRWMDWEDTLNVSLLPNHLFLVFCSCSRYRTTFTKRRIQLLCWQSWNIFLYQINSCNSVFSVPNKERVLFVPSVIITVTHLLEKPPFSWCPLEIQWNEYIFSVSEETSNSVGVTPSSLPAARVWWL